MRFVALVIVALAIGFCFYWFNPRIEADRAWAQMNGEFKRAVDHTREIAEQDGLQSPTVTAALAKATRLQFVTNCASRRFRYNQTTLTEWRAIEADCKEGLLKKDVESRRLVGADYGWEL